MVISRVCGDGLCPMVVAWALGAMWEVSLSEIPELGWAARAGAAVAVIWGVVLSRLGGRKTHWQLRDEAAAAAEAEIAARRVAQ